VALLALPLLVLIVYPFFAEQGYLTYVLLIILAYSIVGLSYNLLLGYLGIPFLGVMIPYAVGGYTTGYLASNHYDPFVAIAIGCVFAAGSGFLFSLPSMRLRGLYMALYSLVFALFFQNLIGRSDIPWLFHIFQGAIGQNALPDITLGGFKWGLHDGLPYYYFLIGLLVATAFVLRRVLDSRFGIAFRSVRDAEVYASTLGVGIFRVKIIGFAIACFFIGLTGSVLTLFYGAIGLDVLDTSNMLLFFSMVVVGGLGTFLGPIVGAFILVPLSLYLTNLGAWRFLISGFAVLFVVLIAPEGVVGSLGRFIRNRSARRTTD
jgi:branched-chain amino acid transport system permease protein